MECAPAVRVLTVRLATPAFMGAVPRGVVPSRNVIVPVAVFGDTVAWNVTGWPTADGFAEEVSVTPVGVAKGTKVDCVRRRRKYPNFWLPIAAAQAVLTAGGGV